MQQLLGLLAALGAFPHFILCKVVPSTKKPGKMDKLPVDHRTGKVCNALDPSAWMNQKQALAALQRYGEGYYLGFVLTALDTFFCIDIDNCVNPDRSLTPIAEEICRSFPGAAVEISQSGRGIHIWGMATAPAHSCKNIPLGIELYTEGRVIVVTGTQATGCAATDHTEALTTFVNKYFTPSNRKPLQEWTSAPVPDYTGPTDDAQLIERAMNSRSASAAFGGKASFADLWECNTEALADAYPDDVLGTGSRAFDASSADAALAQHLAFWTGKDCARILRLMWQSQLVRDKWNRDDYLERTILNACANQSGTLTGTNDGGPKLSGSRKQQEYAKQIRAGVLAQASGEQVALLTATHGPAANAKFWIDHKAETPAQLVERCRPVDLGVTAAPPAPTPSPEGTATPPPAPAGDTSTRSASEPSRAPELRTGYQYLSAEQQIEHFRGCVYVRDRHRVFTPDGDQLKPEQFNAVYGGYSFQLEADGSGKTTRKAWDAFTESQAVTFPKVASTCFRPDLAPGQIITERNRRLVNTYVPAHGERKQGDVSLFLDHVARLLPDENDREIFLSYLAACVQKPGVKFQWAPLIQGAEGNGKTVFYHVLAYSLGDCYAHLPNAAEITNPFNSWLEQKLIIGIEELHTAGRQEVADTLKPWITNKRVEIHGKGQDQRTGDNCANFIMLSNHKDAVLKSENDRRYCVFYTAQQEPGDLERDGMDSEYFTRLYNWLECGGFAHVAHYLASRTVSVDVMGRAPRTSSTAEAVRSSLGVAEQIIQEAIDLEEWGFRGGLVCTKVAGELLKANGKRLSPQKVAGVLVNLGYIRHPALLSSDGKISVDGIRRRLYVKRGSLTANLTVPLAVADAWKRAQVVAGAPCPSLEPVRAQSAFSDNLKAT
jgi:hypothetical protein